MVLYCAGITIQGPVLVSLVHRPISFLQIVQEFQGPAVRSAEDCPCCTGLDWSHAYSDSVADTKGILSWSRRVVHTTSPRNAMPMAIPWKEPGPELWYGSESRAHAPRCWSSLTLRRWSNCSQYSAWLILTIESTTDHCRTWFNCT